MTHLNLAKFMMPLICDLNRAGSGRVRSLILKSSIPQIPASVRLYVRQRFDTAYALNLPVREEHCEGQRITIQLLHVSTARLAERTPTLYSNPPINIALGPSIISTGALMSTSSSAAYIICTPGPVGFERSSIVEGMPSASSVLPMSVMGMIGYAGSAAIGSLGWRFRCDMSSGYETDSERCFCLLCYS